MSLAPFGSACRCLLRLRENSGQSYLSDDDFIRAHLHRFPEWRTMPGAVDSEGLAWLAAQLGLAAELSETRSYENVLAARTAGRAVLVHTDAAPRPDRAGPPQPTTSLLTGIDARGFAVWWPDPRGLGEQLPAVERAWWDRWNAVGTILVEVPVPPSGVPQPAEGGT